MFRNSYIEYFKSNTKDCFFFSFGTYYILNLIESIIKNYIGKNSGFIYLQNNCTLVISKVKFENFVKSKIILVESNNILSLQHILINYFYKESISNIIFNNKFMVKMLICKKLNNINMPIICSLINFNLIIIEYFKFVDILTQKCLINLVKKKYY